MNRSRSQNTERAAQWAVANITTILTAAGVFVAAIFIGVAVITRSKETDERNWTRLGEAQAYMDARMWPQATEVFTQLSQSAAPALREQATYALGVIALEQKDAAKAADIFRGMVAGPSKTPLIALAMANLTQALEEQGDFAGAADAGQSFLSIYPDHFLGARVRISIGRALLRAGKAGEARAALAQVIDLYPSSEWAKMARSMMDKPGVR